MPKKNKNKKQPSDHDLEIWEKVNDDLLDWLYSGITGKFQIAGHHQIDRWMSNYSDKLVVEIGCGHGHHLSFSRTHHDCYIGLDIEYKFLSELRKRHSNVPAICGDAYQLPFKSASVDCILSMYNLEHLHELPRCLFEIQRVLKPNGELMVGIPAEGGAAYELGRQLSSKPYMEKKYDIDYDAIVAWEHWNTYEDIISMTKAASFQIVEKKFIPLNFIPSVHLNIIGCFRATKSR